jgi:hypothetical protein
MWDLPAQKGVSLPPFASPTDALQELEKNMFSKRFFACFRRFARLTCLEPNPAVFQRRDPMDFPRCALKKECALIKHSIVSVTHLAFFKFVCFWRTVWKKRIFEKYENGSGHSREWIRLRTQRVICYAWSFNICDMLAYKQWSVMIHGRFKLVHACKQHQPVSLNNK